jgi:hypothetical protein
LALGLASAVGQLALSRTLRRVRAERMASH